MQKGELMARNHRHITVIILIILPFILMGILKTPVMAAGKTGNFTGTWTANGTKDVLPFGERRETALFKLSGHVNLKDQVGMIKDYWSECIGLADTESGSNIRCVWRGLNGQEIYIVLQSQRLAKGVSVSGTIVGGTGLAAGIKGSLSFDWSTMSVQKQNDSTTLGGYATNLKGTFQLP
jgi:hypothetical protein